MKSAKFYRDRLQELLLSGAPTVILANERILIAKAERNEAIEHLRAVTDKTNINPDRYRDAKQFLKEIDT